MSTMNELRCQPMVLTTVQERSLRMNKTPLQLWVEGLRCGDERRPRWCDADIPYKPQDVNAHRRGRYVAMLQACCEKEKSKLAAEHEIVHDP